jgi:prepilin-type N-terminal cleavage/methylation domain-containing protein
MNANKIVFCVVQRNHPRRSASIPRTHPRCSASTSGFTLIELILVVAIMALTVPFAIVVVRNQVAGNLDGDAQSVKSRLAEAQTRAIAGNEGSAWGIYFDNASTTPYYALFVGAAFASASGTYRLSAPVEFQTPAAGVTLSIVFNKLTGTTATTTAVVLRLKANQQQTETVTVTAQGQISVQ